MTSPKLATDRSMRRYDADGHLHVEMTNISKANVCPYYGREIPDHEALGLDPNRVYNLYRDPAELKAGAHTFANKPLLIHHVPVTADEPARDLWVGTVGGPAEFDGTYLRAPLAVWTADAIKLVETKEQDELSSAYRYRADMTPGRTPDGVAYDGVMRDIMGNHVALVVEGRAGPDVVVADETPPEFSSMKRPKLLAALAALFATAPKPEQLVALDAALDAELDDDKAAMDAMTDEDKKAACDSYAKDTGKALDALTDEDKAEAYSRAAKDKRAKDGAPEAQRGSTPPHAADEAAIKAATDAAVAAATAGLVSKTAMDEAVTAADAKARAEVHALYTARKAVEATVGVVALDSADAVYRFALDHLKVEHKDIPAAALAALYEQSAKAAAAPAAHVAQDSAAQFDPTILGLSHIRKG